MLSFEGAIPMLRILDERLAQVSRGDLRTTWRATRGTGRPARTCSSRPMVWTTSGRSSTPGRPASTGPSSGPGSRRCRGGRVMCVVDPFDNHLTFTDWRDPEG
jgi:hypothetical protein